nr:MAG TPA: hypothetical protein [Caudoviricetes sp.]DAM60624.1 MAG TPA: hypothetical protein [Caudoviricetes sp.]
MVVCWIHQRNIFNRSGFMIRISTRSWKICIN